MKPRKGIGGRPQVESALGSVQNSIADSEYFIKATWRAKYSVDRGAATA